MSRQRGFRMIMNSSTTDLRMPKLPTMNSVSSYLKYLLRRLDEDKCFFSAATLSYTTLLAIVPMLAVAFAVVAAFPVLDQWAIQIQNFVFENYVQAGARETQSAIRDALDEFVQGARALPAGSMVFLLLTALLLIQEIEAAINRIFRVGQKRRLGSRFMMYWVVLSLGPLLVGAGLAMTSALLARLSGTALDISMLVENLLRILPFLVQFLAFLLIYWIVPNRHVRFAHAAIGALVAALLFTASKSGFVWYITTFPTYQKIYGALAVVPIFLLWIYVSWVVTMIGALVAASPSGFVQAIRANPGPPNFSDAIAILNRLVQAQSNSEAVPESELFASMQDMEKAQFDALLNLLSSHGWITQDMNGDWVLKCDAEELSLWDVYCQGGFTAPGLKPKDADSKIDDLLHAKVKSGYEQWKSAMQVPLKSITKELRNQKPEEI